MKELTDLARSIVNNLHQSLIFKIIAEYQKKDAIEIRGELGIEGAREAKNKSLDLLEKTKRHILEKAYQDNEKIEFLMSVPIWAGFKSNMNDFETLEQVILAGKRSALAMLWISILPRISASPSILSSEIENQGIETLVEHLLESEESRIKLNSVMSLELKARGFVEESFDISGAESGYSIDDSMRMNRLREMIALIIMKACDCPFDIDKVFSLPQHRLIEETTFYIITMQSRTSLNYQIAGDASSRPFDWPLVGTARVFARLMTTLDVLRRSASKMTTCSLYSSMSQGKLQAWTDWEFTSFLVREIADYYTQLLRSRSGKGKNEDLKAFIDILNGENDEITSRVMEAYDRSQQLYLELSDCKRRARIGDKARISPERRFRITLSSMKNRLGKAQSESRDFDGIVEEIASTFDAVTEVMEKHVDSLGSQVDKFTQELCFEISFRILEMLDLVASLSELPWVSRFLAEEAARISISRGDMDSLDERYRMKRIVSAFAGGIVYLVLQTRK